MSLPITEDLNPGAYCSTQSITKKKHTTYKKHTNSLSHRFIILYEQMQRPSMTGLKSWAGSYLYLHTPVCPGPSIPCPLCGRG